MKHTKEKWETLHNLSTYAEDENSVDLLGACKVAQKAIYAAINGNNSKLSNAWHDLEQVITKTEKN